MKQDKNADLAFSVRISPIRRGPTAKRITGAEVECPEGMGNVRTNSYADASRSFLAKARKELDGEDLVQASEKVWGAAAQIVKAVAEKRGWRHDSHRALVQVVNRLAAETGDQRLREAFIVAQGLHFNFYENIHPREFVDLALTVIEEFVGKLERV